MTRCFDLTMLYPFMFKALLRISVLALVVSVQAHYNNSHYDYIVVGGGLGGTVVASRLSEDPSISVLLVEAGNFEQYSPNVTNTTVLGIGQGTSLDWQYQSVPQASANNRTITWRAGKGLGGSTLINGKQYDSGSFRSVDGCHRHDVHAASKLPDRSVAISRSRA